MRKDRNYRNTNIYRNAKSKAMITGKNYIGEELSAEGGVTYRTMNPRTNSENEYEFYEATKEEVNAAIEKAAGAFEIYKNTSPKDRAAFLRAIGEEINNLGNELIDTYVTESALPEGRAKGECARTVGQLLSFAEMLEEGSWVEAIITNGEGKPDLRRMLIPIGPVAVFGASNFPLAFSTAGGDTASALAAGCPVVVKSHPLHAATGEMVSQAIVEAARKTGMPDGVFSNLNSSGIEVGQWLVTHPKIKAVGFTGSIKAGTALNELASKRPEPIPVYAEMGSVNPVVVLPSAVEEKAEYWAQQYAGSITAGTGQFCTNPGLLIGLAGEKFDEFVKKLGEGIQAMEPSCMLSPSIKKQYEKSRSGVLANGGFSEVGKLDRPVEDNFAQQHVIAVSAERFINNKAFHQEVFGPFSVVVRCKDKKELDEVLQHLEGQLTGTVLSSDEGELEKFSQSVDVLRSKVGRLIYNNVPTGVDVSPAMTHGGPFPATTDSKFTSVGLTAVKRWVRPVSYQDWPNKLLPRELQNENPLGILRTINKKVTTDAV